MKRQLNWKTLWADHMRRKIFFISGWCTLGLILALPAQAATKSLRELSTQEQYALKSSQQRLLIFDHALQSLENRHDRRKIGAQEYSFEKHDLVALISDEARFENEILTKDPSWLSEGEREVLQNMAKYTVLVPAYAAAILARGMSGSSFSP
jgi:hypothetical protein